MFSFQEIRTVGLGELGNLNLLSWKAMLKLESFLWVRSGNIIDHICPQIFEVVLWQFVFTYNH
jgi:hypothetical protein